MKTALPKLPLCLLLAGVMLSVWSLYHLRASRLAVETAAENLAACRQLADKISALETRPSRAALEAQTAGDLARQIEDAAREAKLPLERLVRIDPQPARRIKDSSYKEQPTGLELQLVNLQQLVTFLYGVAGEDSGLQVSSLRLSAPRNETSSVVAQEQWAAEVILTRLIFAPTTKPPRL